MQRSRRARIHLVVLTTLTLLGASLLPGNTAPASADPPNPPPLPSVVPVCPGPAPLQQARCHSQRRTDVQSQRGGSPNVFTPSGYGPGDLQSAYNLSPPSGAPGTGPIVAIVDAYDDPTAESDLATYRGQFGLGECTSTSKGGNGCFKKVNQNGIEGSYPSANSGWAQEISLDLDMVSAICPNCSILLVESDTNSFNNLAAAVDKAASLGAVAISNSYGGGEWSSVAGFDDTHFNHVGVAITASSGDGGYGVEFPASSRYVTGVGGTSLSRASNARGWSETVWSGAGSGCSSYISKPSWQSDSGCSKRTVADVAAVSDPGTGVAVVYNSGWLVFGGTSVASPIIASVYALAAKTVSDASYLYGHASYGSSGSPATLFDVTSGSNGSCGAHGRSKNGGAPYLCTGVSGYDGPTGLGTPNGTGGF